MNLNSTFLNNLAGEGVLDIVNNFRKEWREEDRYNEKQKLLQKRLDEQARSRNNAMVNKYLDKLPEGVEIKKDDRIAQILFQEIPTFELEEISDLSDSERKEGGFGSTGK